MTKELLEEYKSKKDEIRELQYKLTHINENNAIMGNDTILNYKSGYPVPETVYGVDWDKVDRTVERYERKIDALSKECEEVENFIESIHDSMLRRIFRLYYIDKLTYSQIAGKVHMDKSTVSRKINNFFKLQRMQQMQHYNNN